MTSRHMFAFITGVVAALCTSSVALAGDKIITMTNYADARSTGGIRQGAEYFGNGGDSPGDVFVFDQQLVEVKNNVEKVIGRNAGFCIRTDAGNDTFDDFDDPEQEYDDPDNNYGACQWTLVFDEAASGYSGSLTVAGREADAGLSEVPIVGGTGDFLGATGVLKTQRMPLGGGEFWFRQDLTIITNKNAKKVSHHDDDSDD